MVGPSSDDHPGRMSRVTDDIRTGRLV